MSPCPLIDLGYLPFASVHSSMLRMSFARQRSQDVIAIHARDSVFVHEGDDAELTTHTAIYAGRKNIEIDRHLTAVGSQNPVNLNDVHSAA